VQSFQQQRQFLEWFGVAGQLDGATNWWSGFRHQSSARGSEFLEHATRGELGRMGAHRLRQSDVQAVRQESDEDVRVALWLT
jgi:hypothetical protein